jgi:hypothetical protein
MTMVNGEKSKYDQLLEIKDIKSKIKMADRRRSY